MVKTTKCIVIQEELKSELDKLKTHPRDTYGIVIQKLVDNFKQQSLLTEMAWGVISNAGQGDWTREHEDWQKAAKKWRDEYHKHLSANRIPSKEKIEEPPTTIQPDVELPSARTE